MHPSAPRVVELSDGRRSAAEIAEMVGISLWHVGNTQRKLDLPRLKEGARAGASNPQYKCGRRIDHDGYVLVTAPQGHPYARLRSGRDAKLMYEHRFVLEQKLGRYLLPGEVVDHIDGLTLHNSPENLRLFASNGDHLAATLTGCVPKWSEIGRSNIIASRLRAIEPVDTRGSRRKCGDVRLRQILLAALTLGIDSPFLLGSSHHTKKAGIDMSSRSTIERALADLYARWGGGHTQ